MRSKSLAIFAILSEIWPAMPALAAPTATFEHSTVRLFQAGFDGGAWKVGLEIQLPGKWKTYWRVPGEAGIPPDFNWSGSDNLSSVDVAWPAPGRYTDQAGESIGYKNQVVFPLKARPVDGSKPVHLKLDLFYAVCDDVCVPGKAAVDLALGHASPQPEDVKLYRTYAEKVPVHDHPHISVVNASLQLEADEPVLKLELQGIDDSDRIDIFVYGADEAYFRTPVLVESKPDVSVYSLRVDGVGSLDDLRGKTLQVVVTTSNQALAHEITIE